MTDYQKSQIKNLRTQGYGYKKIGQLTNLSVNTIKTYCKRNSLGAMVVQTTNGTDGVCKCCNAPLVQIPGRKPRKFCSDACKVKWWNEHRELVEHRGDRQIICAHCGRAFGVTENSTRKYCSHACYVADRFRGGELQ